MLKTRYHSGISSSSYMLPFFFHSLVGIFSPMFLAVARLIAIAPQPFEKMFNLHSLYGAISCCPSMRLNIFHPKCQIKVRVFCGIIIGPIPLFALNNECEGVDEMWWMEKDLNPNRIYILRCVPSFGFCSIIYNEKKWDKKEIYSRERENIITNAIFSCMHLLPTNSLHNNNLALNNKYGNLFGIRSLYICERANQVRAIANVYRRCPLGLNKKYIYIWKQ